MAPLKNAPRDALVSAKDERRGMKLRAAIVLEADPGGGPQAGFACQLQPSQSRREWDKGVPWTLGRFSRNSRGPARGRLAARRSAQSSHPALSPGPWAQTLCGLARFASWDSHVQGSDASFPHHTRK